MAVVGLDGLTLVPARRISRRPQRPKENPPTTRGQPSTLERVRGRKGVGRRRFTSRPAPSAPAKTRGGGASTPGLSWPRLSSSLTASPFRGPGRHPRAEARAARVRHHQTTSNETLRGGWLRTRPSSPASHLHQHRVALPAARADRGEAPAAAPAPELVQERRQDPSPARPHRVAERERPAVDVYYLGVDAEDAGRVDRHARERLV